MKKAMIFLFALLTFTAVGCTPDETAEEQVPADTVQTPSEFQEPVPADTPRFTITLQTPDTSTNVTQGECIAGNNVKVDVEIGGGAANNSVLGEAWCGTQKVVADVVAMDPGNGQPATKSKQGTQVAGAARCTRGGVFGQPASNVKVTCSFF